MDIVRHPVCHGFVPTMVPVDAAGLPALMYRQDRAQTRCRGAFARRRHPKPAWRGLAGFLAF
ncbi:hypothetical protein PYV00_02735 [Novosphingobium sp. H3SJ31-1]|uniref:Uncharacterized protein n=1 Tax=Novosphingobium album (ex Liu et al. 2023) TaxID=3031130 RepID=A0ABT5WKQ5_9SPHN|nr:hypothetical protein [Novosphingobium album (ex Liu et al. 2023)]